MENVVFSDKDFLVNYFYKLLDNPTKNKVQKTLYLLFAFYGATYGRLQSNAEEETCTLASLFLDGIVCGIISV
ncbi:Uncharacterised protein [Streptococcus pseudoporcinus]|uniref:Uncharacterized protein n=1 Tax=Streptococcus pseudoporcinus TaxID=361101 RepID=A0A4V6L3X5_9STRE|nr:hypothetical protein [Streptococcus pseudoporcinus]VTS29747.1 Uncharacterised protein [Streptococcus pseudoporcinus]